MIENRRLTFKKADFPADCHPGNLIEERLGSHALRWYIADVGEEELTVEATVFDGELAPLESVVDRLYPGRTAAVSIIPTGVGCEIGGYAGDAAPATRLLAQAVDYLITNPNAVNASNFIDLDANVLYTEGLCIDRFCGGKAELYVPHANRVGLIIEKTSEENLDLVYNVINTARAVHGIDIVACEITPRPVGSHCVLNGSGAYVGIVDHPEEILAACRKLLAAGVEAIGITTNIQDLPHDEYVLHFEGRFPNPLGGVEAIISHLIVNEFQVPAAHAPMVNCKDLALADHVVDARGAGEMASASGLACILLGLARAPQIDRGRAGRFKDAINVNNLLAVVAPASCLGGLPVTYAQQLGIPVIAVEENATVLAVTEEKLAIDHLYPARNYLEAAGILLALRHGISPGAVTRPLETLRPAHRQPGNRRTPAAADEEESAFVEARALA